MKFKLHDIRESKVWKEAHGGREEGMDVKEQETVRKLSAKGMSLRTFWTCQRAQ